MASVQEAFAQFFATDGEILAVIGERSFDSVLPPNARIPAAVFNIFGPRDLTHSRGVEAAKTYFAQLDLFAPDAGVLRPVVATTHGRMRLFRGSWGGIQVHRALLDGMPFHTLEPALNGGPTPYHRNVSRWELLVAEPTAVAF